MKLLVKEYVSRIISGAYLQERERERERERDVTHSNCASNKSWFLSVINSGTE